MTTELTRFTQWAAEKPQERYTSLMGMLADVKGLAESFARQKANKAPGVDGVRKADYEHELEARLADLHARLRRMAYRPKPARRVYISKGRNKGWRPLGLPSFEDRLAGGGPRKRDSASDLGTGVLRLFTRISAQPRLPHGHCPG